MASEDCRVCGTALDPESAFCKNCGAPVRAPGTPSPEASDSSPIDGRASSDNSPTFGQASPADRLAAAYAYSQMPDPAYDDCEPLGVGQYLMMMLITAIPVVGLIVNLVWAFGGSTNFNRRNFAKAAIILSLIGLVLTILFGGLVIAVISIIRDNYGNF